MSTEEMIALGAGLVLTAMLIAVGLAAAFEVRARLRAAGKEAGS